LKPILVFLLLVLMTPLLTEDKNSQKVTLQLQWLDQFQFAGYYMAKEKGFYKDAGLNVEIKKFGPGIMPVDEVVGKKATYGVGRSSLIIDKSQGKEIVLLASIFQSSPEILLARKDSNIKTVKDFVGKKVMMTPDALGSVPLRAMINKSGISIANMIKQKHSFNINDLINKKTDLMASYISNEPYLLKEKGIAYTVFDPKDYGFDFYSDILFTSADEIREHRQRAIDFTEASLKGWEYAFSHIDETVALIHKKYNTQKKSKAALIFEANTLKNLADFDKADFGQISRVKIEKITAVYNVMGLLKNKIDYDEFVLNHDQNRSMWSNEEQNYLKQKKEIRVCVDPNWMPFEAIQDGKYIGMSADYMRIVESNIGIPFRLVPTNSWGESMAYAKARKCDMLSLVMETPERKKYFNFTPPYLVVPLVIATTTDKFFIADLKEVLDKKFGVVKGYAFTQQLKQKYPSIKLVEVENIEDGLNAVAQGKLFGFIDNLTTIGYQMQKSYIGTLKIAGRIDQNWELGFGVRNDEPILQSILNKALDHIDEKTKQSILNQWISIDYEQGFDYTLFWKILGGLAAFFAFLIYRYILVQRYNKTLSALNQELEKLSITDPLTKLYNRRYLYKSIEMAQVFAERYKTPFSVIMLDIDNFKEINDTYGHDEGDIVLQKIANILLAQSRESDIVGRWGGEEFLIICQQSKIDGALTVAEKICHAIEKEVFANKVTVTASFGVAEYSEKTKLTVIVRADNALYKAKKEGKNKVVADDE
jgi:polar amino acid transport system substrate-binding protein